MATYAISVFVWGFLGVFFFAASCLRLDFLVPRVVLGARDLRYVRVMLIRHTQDAHQTYTAHPLRHTQDAHQTYTAHPLFCVVYV